MSKKKENITGIVKCKEGNICFFEDNYIFTFMRNELSNNEYVIKPKSGYIHGKTHDNHSVLIPYHSEINLYSVARLKTYMYLYGNNNVNNTEIDEFNVIVFKGGTLNLLQICNALKHDLGQMEDGKFIYEFQNNAIEFDFIFDNSKCHVTIYSNISEHSGITGTGLKNEDIILTIEFDEKQALDTVSFHVGRIKQILSILTYRKNVGFDEIIIRDNVDEIYKTNTANVFLHEDQEFTKRHLFNNLTFMKLGNCASKFFEIVYNLKENKPNYDFSFIPDNDKDSNYYTSEKIRNIASALECEMEFIEIPQEQNDDLNDLIKNVKQLVKAHKRESSSLEERTYTSIFNNISHWKMSETERIWYMFLQYQEAMGILLNCEPTHCKTSIEKFVKHRNGTTHGRHQILDSEIVDIAYGLSGLVYCFFLSRIGFTTDEINNLFRNNFLM